MMTVVAFVFCVVVDAARIRRAVMKQHLDKLNAAVESNITADCETVTSGECFDKVKWAMDNGITQHPEWYPFPLSTSSSFEDFQHHLYNIGHGGCPLPCSTSPWRGRMKAIPKELEHFELVNKLRAEGFTCPDGTVYEPNPIPLKWHCGLFRAAQWHSQDMADQDYFGPTSKDGRTTDDRVEEQGATWSGENLACGSDNPKDSLESLMKSNGHCFNLMKPSYTSLGIGYAHNEGSSCKHYWTEVFSWDDGDDLDQSGCLDSNILRSNAHGAKIRLAEPDIKEADNEAHDQGKLEISIAEPAVPEG